MPGFFPVSLLHPSLIHEFCLCTTYFQFLSLRIRLSRCFCVSFSLLCHPMCLLASLLHCPPATWLTKTLLALKAWWQLFSKSVAKQDVQGRKHRIISEAKRMYGGVLCGFFFLRWAEVSGRISTGQEFAC